MLDVRTWRWARVFPILGRPWHLKQESSYGFDQLSAAWPLGAHREPHGARHVCEDAHIDYQQLALLGENDACCRPDPRGTNPAFGGCRKHPDPQEPLPYLCQ